MRGLAMIVLVLGIGLVTVPVALALAGGKVGLSGAGLLSFLGGAPATLSPAEIMQAAAKAATSGEPADCVADAICACAARAGHADRAACTEMVTAAVTRGRDPRAFASPDIAALLAIAYAQQTAASPGFSPIPGEEAPPRPQSFHPRGTTGQGGAKFLRPGG